MNSKNTCGSQALDSLGVKHLFVAAICGLLIACGGGGGSDVGSQEDQTPPTAIASILGNQPPASGNYKVRSQTEVLLTGKDSFSTVAPILSFSWKQVSGTSVVLNERSAHTVAFQSPVGKDSGTLNFELTITDGNGNSDSTQILVDVLAMQDANHFLTDPNTPDNKLKFLAALQAGTDTGSAKANVVLEIDTIAHWINRLEEEDQLLLSTESVSINFPENFSASVDYNPLLEARNPIFTLTLPSLNADDINQNFESDYRDRRLDPYNFSTAYLTLTIRVVSTDAAFELYAIDTQRDLVAEDTLAQNKAKNFKSIEKIESKKLSAPKQLKNNTSTGALLQTWQGHSSALINVNNALNTLGIENSITANNYYALIDPDAQFTKLKDWQVYAGFKDEQGNDINENSIAHAIYVNNYDLGFGRDMYLREDNLGNVFSYVTNYPSLETAIDGRSEFAVVAMEYSDNPDPEGANSKIVKFWVFIYDERTGEFVRTNSMNFDGRGEKYVPNVCTACHQSYPGEDTQYTHVSEADLGATFIPWDLDSFLYSQADNPNQVESTLNSNNFDEQTLEQYSRTAQEQAFKNLNLGALKTYLGEPERHAAAIELIHGWYGDENLDHEIDSLPSNTLFDGQYIQPGWQDQPELYHDVYARNCRICHTQMLDETKNFDAYSELISSNQLVSYVYNLGIMPMARLTMDRFWIPFDSAEQSAAEQLRSHLISLNPEAVSETLVPGTPKPSFTLSSTEPTINESVLLDASASEFSQQFTWEITSKPSGSNAELITDSGLITSFLPDLPGALYEITLTTSNSEGINESISQSFTSADQIPVADCLNLDTGSLSSEGLLDNLEIISQLQDLGDGGVTIASITNGSFGSANISADGQNISYQLNNPFNRGIDTLTYQIQDSNSSLSSPGSNCSGTSTLTIDTTDSGTLAPYSVTAETDTILDSSSISITWQSPDSITPDSYNVYRDGNFLANTTTTTYTDTNLAADSSYSYQVLSVINGFSSNLSSAATATTLSLLPNNLSSVAIDSYQVNLSWDEPLGNRNNFGDSTQYTLYRSEANDPNTPVTPTTELVNSHTTTALTDSGLTPGTSYGYAIRANTSIDSSPLTSTITVTTPPLEASNLALNPGSDARTQIDISWDAPTGHVSNYIVSRQLGSGAFTQIATPPTNSYSDTGLDESSQYTYQVTSEVSGQYSNTITSASLTTASPSEGQPSGFSAAVNSAVLTNASQIELAWTKPSAYDPDSYTLSRDNNDNNFVIVGSCCIGTDTNFIDTNLTPGEIYRYRLVATKDAIDAEYVQAQAATLSLTPTLSASAISTTATTLTWTAPAAEVSSYTLSRTGLNISNASSGYSDTTLSAGTTYDYTLTAHQGSTNGADNLSVTTEPNPATSLNQSGATASSISLSWSSSTGNSNDGSIGYNIYRNDDSYTAAIISDVSGTNYTDNSTGQFSYRVFAIYNGVESSSYTQVTAASLATAPVLNSAAAPGTSTNQINLSWTDPGDSSITGYNIYRSDNSYATAIASNVPGHSYSDSTSLSTATEYSYRITAVTAGGESAVSNTVTGATYPAVPTGASATVNSASQITVNWGTSSNGSNVRYTVTPSTGASVSNINANSQAMIGLNGYTSYTFTVTATANGLSSSASSASSAKTTLVSYTNNVQPSCEGCHVAGNHHGLNNIVYNVSTNTNGYSANLASCIAGGCTGVMPSVPASDFAMIQAWINEGRNTGN